MLAFLLVENIAVRPDQRGRDRGDNLYTHSERGACLDCVQLYTNGAFDSNLNSAPAVGSKNSNG